jgi:hypothetical protein
VPRTQSAPERQINKSVLSAVTYPAHVSDGACIHTAHVYHGKYIYIYTYTYLYTWLFIQNYAQGPRTVERSPPSAAHPKRTRTSNKQIRSFRSYLSGPCIRRRMYPYGPRISWQCVAERPREFVWHVSGAYPVSFVGVCVYQCVARLPLRS